MSPVESPQAPSSIPSASRVCIRPNSAAVGARLAKPIAATRRVPWPMSWITLSAVPMASNARR